MIQFTNRIGHSLVWVSGPVLWLGDAAAAPPPHLVAPPSPRVALNNPPPSHPRNSEPRTHGSSAAKSRARGHPTQNIHAAIFSEIFLFVSQIGLFMKLLINSRTAAVTVGKKKVMVGNPSQTHAVNFPRRTCHTPDSSLLFGK